jgi:benzoyl-CoA reductase/2-hydroxyglutaryl-CoA dehydratase subunit BcrC/BadD/HgdB
MINERNISPDDTGSAVRKPMKKIGITTTVPIEVLIAAGYQPVDLNNILVADPDPGRLINIAERAGFPLNCCSWIKGIYGVCMEYDIDTVMGVTGGDCSNTIMLTEVLKLKRCQTISFAYPDKSDSGAMQVALESLAAELGTTIEAAEKVRNELKACRVLALKLDEMTWHQNTVSGRENHLWLVSTSDFNGDTRKYKSRLQELVSICSRRQPYPPEQLRLAYIGVPAVYAGELYDYLENNEARVVFNEVQRQFAMPEPGISLVEQYTNYTYPYSIRERLKDIRTEIRRRRIDGVIHYAQAFCHRGIADIIFRDALKLPVLMLEGNDDFSLNNHVRTRIEAFLDMILRNQSMKLKMNYGKRALKSVKNNDLQEV